jgi:hypothetical protein
MCVVQVEGRRFKPEVGIFDVEDQVDGAYLGV